MAATETLARLGPYAEGLAENDYVQEKLRSAAHNLRGAYERSQKRRVKATRDEKLRAQVQAAARSMTEAGKALASGHQKPKQRRGRRLLLLLTLGALAAGAALAANEQLREAIFGGRDGELGESAAPPSPQPSGSPAA